MFEVEEYTIHKKIIYYVINYERIGKRFIEKKEKIKLKETPDIKGYPDYEYYKKGKKYYIEFKGINDGLRLDQLKFCMDKKNRVRVIWIKITYDIKKSEEECFELLMEKIDNY